MTRSRAVPTAVVASAAVVSGALAWMAGVALIDWLFFTVILSCLGGLGVRAVRAWAAAADAQRRAAALAVAEPDAVARAAVREERRRLSEDIAASLRGALERISRDAQTALTASDPRPSLSRIRDHTRTATSELRRQLGLLRQEKPDAAEPAPAVTATSTVSRTDVIVALAVTLLAVTESVVYARMDGEPLNGLSLVLIALAAATVVAGRTLPAVAALVIAGLYLVAIPLGAPLHGGFWALVAVAGLIWTICGRAGSRRLDLAAALVLTVASGLSTWLLDRDNAGFWLVVLAVSVVGGLTVRWARRRAAASSRVAERHQTELDSATRTAVAAERGVFARELHDVVSHAIGLIAVQAGAAEVLWPSDRTAASRSIAIILETADATLGELNRLVPDRPVGPLTVAHLEELVQRIRLAGTPVRLHLDADAEAPLDAAAYRVVQEALTNVVRHAPEASAAVSVRTEPDGRTWVEVVDDGAGVGVVERGYGLVGLEERVGLAGGLLEVGAAQHGAGFRVVAVLPAAMSAPG